MAERGSSPMRPLDAIRKATFAHLALQGLAAEGADGAAAADRMPQQGTVEPPRTALKPKRRRQSK